MDVPAQTAELVECGHAAAGVAVSGVLHSHHVVSVAGAFSLSEIRVMIHIWAN